MTIRELMSGGLITVSPETPVPQARDVMARERIRPCRLTGLGGALAGISTVTDRHLALRSRQAPACRRRIGHLLSSRWSARS